jgi:predicted GH43/DUF377 family glycosyl hydrolase
LLEWTFLSMKNISATTGITLNWKHPKNHCCGTRMWFFPRKIKGKFYLLHRIKPNSDSCWYWRFKWFNRTILRRLLAHFNDHVVLTSKFDHEISYVGGGCPPIETDQGWLIIYHGVKDGLMDTIRPALLYWI